MTWLMLDIHNVMTGLEARGLIINSRPEFHDALCGYLCEAFPNDKVVPEIHPRSYGKTKFIVGIPSRGVAIRLWYPRAGKWRDNLTRYEFLRDVDRMERAIADVNWLRHGLVVMLTDMSKLWEVPETDPRRTQDAALRIHHDAMLKGTLNWGGHTSPGIKLGRKQPIQLDGQYLMDWRAYSVGGDGQCLSFRYLAVEVGN